MGCLTILVLKGPYTSRHAEFACEIAEEIKTSVLLIEDGVFCALEKERPKDIGYPGLSELVSAIIKLDGKVYTDASSCEVRGIKEEELIEGVEMVSHEKEAQILVEAQGAIVV